MTIKMPDSYYNGFDATKHRERILFRDGKVLQGQEMNEAQDIAIHRLKGVGDALFSDGDVIRDAQIAVSELTGEVQASSGAVYLDGAVREVSPATFTIPVEGTISVGIRLTHKVVSHLEDPTLLNPAVGRGEGEQGAWRETVEAVWGFEGDGGDGEFYPVYVVDNGLLRAKETPPSLDSTNQAISKYDRDSTGGGTYIVSGLTVRTAEDVEGAQMYTVTEGRARVNGYGIEIPTSRRLKYEAVPDLRLIDTEVMLADETGNQRIDVAHPPIRNVQSLRITVQRTADIVHGAYIGASDSLPDTAVVEILSVVMGDTTFEAGTDYKKSGDAVDWSPSGNEPAPGSTYKVTYNCNVAATPEALDLDGFTVNGAVPGTQIIMTYNQALPRLDRLALTQDGVFSWIKGVASEYNQIAPTVPSGMLALATVSQTWRPGRSVSNDGVRVYSFGDIETLFERVDYALSETARQRLESDVTTRESGMKAGLFVDPLNDDSMRDQGITQTGAIVYGELTLPVSAEIHALDAVSGPVSRDFTSAIALSQTLRTTSMQVNPYMSFEPLPAQVTLTPSVDRWTESQTLWTSPVTETFRRASSRVFAGTINETTTGTQTVSTTTQRLTYLRQIDVAFSVKNFGPGEKLRSLTFDGLDVTPSTPLTADASGSLSGKFRIPAKVPAGSKTVAFNGEGGSRGTAVFTGQGTLTVQTLRQVTQVIQWYDPLAQTFVVDEDMQLAGVDLWFTAKGKTGARVQIREVSGGVPGRAVLAEAVVPASSIVVSGGGSTRIAFPSVLSLTANTEYALIVLCDDAQTSVAVAEMGKFDSLAQQWVVSQPYTIGVLLSSSNASSWTAHQNRDLAFRLLRATFSGTKTVSLGSVEVSGATDLILLALSEIPSSQSRIEYELALPDGTKVVVADSQPLRFPQALTGTVSVTAMLSGNAAFSPVLWPDAQLIVGTVSPTADYYARSVPAKNGDRYATKAVLIYDALIPSGAAITPEIQVDSGEWVAMVSDGTTKQDNDVIEFRFTKTLSSAQLVKLRFRLSGTSGSRPSVGNIRFMTVA